MDLFRLSALFAALSILAAALSGNAAAQPAACAGADMVEKMRRDNPDRYQAMLDHFAAIENNEGIFWQIEKPGVKPSYLFGTAHVTDQRVLDHLQIVEPVLKNARALIVEIADLNPNMSRQMAIVQQYGMLPAGETLDDRLSETEQKLLGEATARHGMPWFSARRMRATFLSLTMSIPACAKVAMMRGEKVLDARLIGYAQENNVPVIGLETLDEQLSLINSLDEGTQLAALLEGVRAGSQLTEDMYETTIRMHQRGRIAMMLSLSEQMKADYPAASKAMESFEGPVINERNIRMQQRALGELEKGGVFIAVGALHLPGSTGLVKLFADAGYSLTRAGGL